MQRFINNLKTKTDVPIELSILPDIIGDSDLKSDTVHPNAKGYKEMANGVYNFLKEVGLVAN